MFLLCTASTLMRRILFAFLVLSLSFIAIHAQAQFGIGDVINMKRVSDPQVSPDGRSIAYTIGVVDKVANKTLTQIYTMGVDGSHSKQLTNGSSSSSAPRWSPDGKRIAFITGGQIWTMDADGDHKDQITKISSGASQPVWSPDGQWIAFISDVYPQCATDACNKAEDDKAEASKVKAHVTDRLLFRHWVEWRESKRTHVFVVPYKGGAARDMTPGDFDSPPYAAASGVDYAFSKNSQGLV
jgi:dipeptidyl aminopeptidase/acylaminoacyl peptidase